MRFLARFFKARPVAENRTSSYVLAVNGGSSSIKFALFESGSLTRAYEGIIERIGTDDAFIETRNLVTKEEARKSIPHEEPAKALVASLEHSTFLPKVAVVGYRVVHGGERYHGPILLREDVLSFLESISSYAPRHLPSEIALIRLLMELIPACEHVACFDTAFHHALPARAQLLPIPPKYRSMGVRRYGFHGLSYEYLLDALRTTYGVKTGSKRIVLAHLGSGVSLTAVKGDVSVDTTMGFTPNSGLPMTTRSGDLDAGIFEYFVREIGMSADEFDHMINYESGLFAISGLTGDMEVLLKHESAHEGAQTAIEYFVHHVKKNIGALAASMGGIDVLVFTGGMGERSSTIRQRICDSLGFLGVEVDGAANAKQEDIISRRRSRVRVYRIPANEELMLARHAQRIAKTRRTSP